MTSSARTRDEAARELRSLEREQQAAVRDAAVTAVVVVMFGALVFALPILPTIFLLTASLVVMYFHVVTILNRTRAIARLREEVRGPRVG